VTDPALDNCLPELRSLQGPTALDGASIVFVQRSANRDGSAISGLMIAGAFVAVGAQVTVVFGHDGDIVTDYEQAGCRCHIVPHGDWLRPGGWIRSCRRIIIERRAANWISKIVREAGADIVYVNSLVSYAGALSGHRCRIPVVWHVRELFSDVGGEVHAPRMGGKWLVSHILRSLSIRIIANSKAVRDSVSNGNDYQDVIVLPNSVPDEFFLPRVNIRDARRELGIPVDSFVVGVPGTLRPVKGHDFLFNAVPEIVRRHPNCIFAVTGCDASETGTKLHNQVRSMKLTNSIRFLGTIDEMRTFYSAVDVVCVPSRSESFGRVIVEAFASGNPVVATSVGGITTLVDHGRNGLLVEYGDTNALVDTVCSLIECGQARGRLATEGRNDAESKFRSDACADRVIEIVHEVLCGQRTS